MATQEDAKRCKISDNEDAEKGVALSSEQLHELWKNDFVLANEFLGLPLRNCSATPVIFGTPMPEPHYQRFKQLIRKMWMLASAIFEVFEDGEKGWALRVKNTCDGNLSITDRLDIMKTMGWIAICPSPAECPTGHRYLRSPVATNCYLGGPLSLANWDQSRNCTVKVTAHIYSSKTGKYFMTTVRPLAPLTPVTWNYGHSRKGSYPQLYSKNEWHLPCCTENLPNLVRSNVPPIAKKPTAPRRLNQAVEVYRPCIYCDEHMDGSEGGKLKNMKNHLATSHTAEFCGENKSISSFDFLCNLHILTEVLKCLKAHNYHVFPACSYFSRCSVSYSSEPSVQEKQRIFLEFLKEAKKVFHSYRIIFLKGISLPTCFDDLLPSKRTNYASVEWQGNKPASNKFSVGEHLTTEEKASLELAIHASVLSVIFEAQDKLA